MTEPTNPLDLRYGRLAPYLPWLGAIAVEATRLEWDLAQLAQMLTDEPLQNTLQWKDDEKVKAIKVALRGVPEATTGSRRLSRSSSGRTGPRSCWVSEATSCIQRGSGATAHP